MYGIYYYNFVAYHGLYLMGCSFSSFFFGILNLNARMHKNLSVANITVLPDGENLRVLMFNGKLYDTPIKDCFCHEITPTKVSLKIKVNNRDLRVHVDNSGSLMK